MKKFKLLLILLILIFSSTQLASAKGGFVTQSKDNTIFYSYDTDVNATKEKYPFNSNATIKSVGFDVLYGVSKDLVQYTGEVPYANTRDDKGDALTGFKGLPYNNTNTSVDISDSSYWGSTAISSGSKIDVETLEKVNADTVASVRLHALSIATSRGFLFFGNLGYFIIKGLAWLASLLSSLIIMIKNINMSDIINALDLGKLGDLMNELFISSTTASGARMLSPFALFCIISFVLSIVAFVYSYVKGGKKAKNLLSDIVLVALIGLMIVGMALNNKATQLGTNVSDLTTKIVQTINQSMSSNIFSTATSGKDADSSMDTSYTEQSLVNKALIDMQICTQFGVEQISELSFSNLGDTSNDIAKAVLTNYTYEGTTYSATDDFSKVDYNLGYYFWWANSSAATLSDYTSPPNTNTLQEAKLTNVITYLQRTYDNALSKGETVRADKIKIMVEHVARPSIGSGVLSMLLLTAIYVLLAICLWKYAFKTVLAKMTLIAGILALPIAGLLIITTKPKLVNTGKGLLGIFAISFVRITVFSIFFDIVLFVLTAMLSTNVLTMLICVILLFFMMKLNPAIELKLESFLQGVEKTVSPASRQLKQNARVYARRKLSETSKKLEQSNANGEIIGYDSSGNAIRKTSRRNILARNFVDSASNALTDQYSMRRSLGNITRTNKADASASDEDARSRANVELEKKLKAKEASIDRRICDINEDIRNEVECKTANVYLDKDDRSNIHNYNAEKLNDEEKSLLDKAKLLDSEHKNLVNDQDFANLRRKSALNQELTKDEQAKLSSYEKTSSDKAAALNEQKAKLQQSIKQRLEDDARATRKDELVKAFDDKIAVKQEQIEAGKTGHKDKNMHTGLKEIVYDNKRSLEDFENMRLIEKQREMAEKAQDISKATLSATEKRAAKQEYEDYIQSNALYGAGVNYSAKKQQIDKANVEATNKLKQAEAERQGKATKPTISIDDVIYEKATKDLVIDTTKPLAETKLERFDEPAKAVTFKLDGKALVEKSEHFEQQSEVKQSIDDFKQEQQEEIQRILHPEKFE